MKITNNIITIIALILGLIGLTLSFLPLRMIGIIPSVISVAIGVIAILISKKNNLKKGFAYIVSCIGILGILIASTFELTTKKEIAEDKEFKQKIEQTAQETDSDLDEALEGIE